MKNKFKRLTAVVSSAAIMMVTAVSAYADTSAEPSKVLKNMPVPCNETQTINEHCCTGGVSDTEIMILTDEEAAEADKIIEGYNQDNDSDVEFTYDATFYDCLYNDYSDDYFYSQMSSKEQELYDTMYYIAMDAAMSKQDYSLTMRETKDGYALIDSVYCPDMSSDRVNDIYRAFRLSNPQFFFLGGAAYGSNKVYLYTRHIFNEADERAAAYNIIVEKTTAMLEEINAYSTVMEKEEAIYRIICDNNTYDYEAYNNAKENDKSLTPYSQTIAGFFLKNTAVCEGYAHAFTYLCNLVGIESVNVLCIGGDHQWNMVNLYGNWYLIDTCWMDGNDINYNYDYCNQSLEYVQNVSDSSYKAHIPDSLTYFEFPSCTKNSHEIYLRTSDIAYSDSDIRNGCFSTNLDNYNNYWYGYWEEEWKEGDLYVEGAEVSATAYAEDGCTATCWDIFEWDNNYGQWVYSYTVQGNELNFEVGDKDILAVAVIEVTEPVDYEGIQNFVDRLYTVLLGRNAEPEGLADWSNRLATRKATSADIVYGIAASDEFKNFGLSNEETVERLYQAMLGRPSDAAGKADWLNALNNGMTINGIINGFSGSEEFGKICAGYGIKPGSITNIEPRDRSVQLTNFTARMYTKALGRTYEVAGLNDWTGRYINNEISLNDMAYGFIFSDEFTNRGLSDEEYLEVLYQTFFDRPSDEGGKTYWLTQMKYGATRSYVLDGFLGSEEFFNLVARFGL